MEISFDPVKREKTLRERGLDFWTPEVLGGVRIEQEDDRFDYGEVRINDRWFSSRPNGRGDLDPARHRSTRHFNAKGKCT